MEKKISGLRKIRRRESSWGKVTVVQAREAAMVDEGGSSWDREKWRSWRAI